MNSTYYVGLNNILLAELFIVVNNIVEHFYYLFVLPD